MNYIKLTHMGTKEIKIHLSSSCRNNCVKCLKREYLCFCTQDKQEFAKEVLKERRF